MYYSCVSDFLKSLETNTEWQSRVLFYCYGLSRCQSPKRCWANGRSCEFTLIHLSTDFSQIFLCFILNTFCLLLITYRVKVFMLNLIIKFLDKPNINICLQVIKILADSCNSLIRTKNKLMNHYEQFGGSLWIMYVVRYLLEVCCKEQTQEEEESSTKEN